MSCDKILEFLKRINYYGYGDISFVYMALSWPNEGWTKVY